jgi:hypothetical protein
MNTAQVIIVVVVVAKVNLVRLFSNTVLVRDTTEQELKERTVKVPRPKI